MTDIDWEKYPDLYTSLQVGQFEEHHNAIVDVEYLAEVTAVRERERCALEVEQQCPECAAAIRKGNENQETEVARLQRALRSILNHWDEFGPEHGLDETLDSARAALRGKP